MATRASTQGSAITGKPRLNKSIRIEVTQADIDAGTRRSSRKDMMALAISRALKRVVTATTRFVMVEDPLDADASGPSATRTVWYAFCDRTIERVKAFDEGRPVKPFVTIIHGA